MLYVQKGLNCGKILIKMTKNKILYFNKLITLLLGIILLYSFFSSLIFGYTGSHWIDKIDTHNIIILNISTVILIVVLFFLFFKFKSILINRFYLFSKDINIWYIFFLALFIRILWVYVSGNAQVSDFDEFNQYAIEILAGSENILDYISGPKSIGVSVFIYLVYFIFGINEIYPLLFIAFFSSLQIYFIYNIVKTYSSNQVAIIASIILSIHPEHIILTNLLGSDVLYTTLIYFGVFLISKYSIKNQIIFFLIGIILGLSYWTRATASVFIFSILLYILIKNKWNIFLKKSLFFLVGFFMVISPIIVFNFNKSGNFDLKPIHGQFGKSLLIGTFNKGDGRYNGWLKHEDHKYLDNMLYNYNNKISTLNDFERASAEDEVFTKIAIDRLKNKPINFLKLVLKHKLTNLWGIVAGLGFSLDTSIFSDFKNLIWGYSELFHRILVFLCSIILVKKYSRKIIIDVRFILVTAAILTTLAHVFLESHPRYHHVFVPLFVIFSAECIYFKKPEDIRN